MKFAYGLLLILLASAHAHAKQPQSAQKNLTAEQPQIRVMFTPQDNVQAELVRVLAGAKKEILVQAYLLTDNKISNALIAAHRRGVVVRVLLDAKIANQAAGSDDEQLAQSGIEVRLETQYDNAHNKVMIIDAHTVVTGSYNFTYSAQYKNAENVLFIQNAPELVRRYTQNWQAHFAKAQPMKSFTK